MTKFVPGRPITLSVTENRFGMCTTFTLAVEKSVYTTSISTINVKKLQFIQTYNTIQYNIILLKKLSGRSLTRIKLHVVVTSDQ